MSNYHQVLIADDSRSIRDFLHRHLNSWGFNVESFSNGKDVWNHFSHRSQSTTLTLDWEMPGYSGLELCQKIKHLELSHYVYIILLTSRANKNDIIHGLNSGADDYLTKPFDPEELKARLKVACRVVLFEDKLHQKEQEVRLECYRALTELAEIRDKETGDHLNRVSEMSSYFAFELGMDSLFQRQIKIYSTMHDIGKVGIPDCILNKPGKLDEKEFSVIKTHTTLGWNILNGKETLKMGAEIAKSHHEHWDGTGYPAGLTRENIPLSARIVSIIDVYDALRSKRPYKEPWPHKKACACIEDNAGTLFDPRLADIFIRHADRMQKIYDLQAG